MGEVLQKNWPGLFKKNVKVIKDKERLKNYSEIKDTKDIYDSEVKGINLHYILDCDKKKKKSYKDIIGTTGEIWMCSVN